MKKKPSKSKAKRSRGKPPRIPRDPVTGQQFIFDPATGKPTLPRRRASEPPQTAEEVAARRERIRASLAKDEARRQEFRQKRERHDSAGRRYRLPDDVRRFLDRLYDEPDLWPYDEPQIARERVEKLLREVYVQGCTQGYIEGRVVDLEPRREQSRKMNAARRQKHNLDQRDAEIVEKYRRLRAVPLSAGDAQARLADEHGLTDKMIRIIIGKANKAAR